MNMARNMVVHRDPKQSVCSNCGHTGYDHFYDRVGDLAECHHSGCHCLRFGVEKQDR